MKTLISNIERKSIPILRNVRVFNKIAYSTDLDVTVVQPTELEDGLYRPETFGDLDIKSDMADNVFPTLAEDEIDYSSGWVTLSREQISILLKSCAKKYEHRIHLQGICVDAPNKTLVSSDGYRMTFIRIEELSGDLMRVVPTKAWTLALKACAEKKVKKLKFQLGKQRAYFLIEDIKIVSNLGENYPDWQKIVPADGDYKVFWDAEEYATIFPTLKRLSKINKALCAQLNGAIEFEGQKFPLKESFPLEIGFNFKYLADLPSGQMQIKDVSSPILVRGDVANMVLMPMRL